MKERLFLDGVSADTGDVTIFKGVKTLADIPAGSAEAHMSFRD